MGFRDKLNSLKDRLVGGEEYYGDNEGYYGDDGYSDAESWDEPAPAPRPTGGATASSGGGLLGNTPRPEAESVSVYTRSGRPVGGNGAGAPVPDPDVTTSMAAHTPVAPYTPSTAYAPASGYDAAADAPARSYPRPSGTQLPPYVLKPQTYDEVQTVVRRVRTNQPVVLVFRNTNIECAKRILDFCFGFSFGVNGEVTELGDRVFAVLPAGVTLSDADIAKLVADGDLVR